jgi:hypothetical protein
MTASAIGDNLVKKFSERISKDESKFSCSKRLDAKRNVRKFKNIIGIYWSFIVRGK